MLVVVLVEVVLDDVVLDVVDVLVEVVLDVDADEVVVAFGSVVVVDVLVVLVVLVLVEVVGNVIGTCVVATPLGIEVVGSGSAPGWPYRKACSSPLKSGIN